MQLANEMPLEESDVEREVLAGLRATAKTIAPKYFYDRKGSALFEAITELDEYYIPAAERSIIDGNRAAICARLGTGRNVVEPGAGSCEKIRWLLPDLQPAVYVPMDISVEHLAGSTACLRADCPDLDVMPVVCDHSAGVEVPVLNTLAKPVFFYPGSSIGNFDPPEVVNFLESIRRTVGAGGGLLVGVDTKKDPAVLNAAYNDAKGITARFNLNVLAHLNELLDGDFDLNSFEHFAHYNEEQGRIEMHLRSLTAQQVQLANQTVRFAAGETVHTENSYKYYPHEFEALADEAGFSCDAVWQDERKYFSVMYFRAA